MLGFMRASMADASAPPSSATSFAFAFNNINFSDRLLRIEIFPHAPASDSGAADWPRVRKRRRAETSDGGSRGPDFELSESGQRGGTRWEPRRRTRGNDRESPSNNWSNQPGDDVASRDKDRKVKTVHISSAILAAQSPFFYKLFTNGVKEPKQQEVTMRIRASEEAAVMELLNFMYSRTLTVTVIPLRQMLDVLMAAGVYEVASCVSYCTTLLLKLPMTFEAALLYLDLPSALLEAHTVQPLADAAKQFLIMQYKNKITYDDEALKLPLAAIEAIFSCDDLRVDSEDHIYYFLKRWALLHYPDPEARQEVVKSRLVRFPHLTCETLKKVLEYRDYGPTLTSKLVTEALFFKIDHSRYTSAEKMSCCAERAYQFLRVKAVTFERPWEKCISYMDLKRDECVRLFAGGRVRCRPIHFGDKRVCLSCHCNTDPPSSDHFFFGLFMGILGKDSFPYDFKFSAWSGISGGYENMRAGSTGRMAVVCRNLFGMPWSSFIADDNPYFINGILHLRAEITIRR